MLECHELLPGLWQLADPCNVYLVRAGDRALAIDYGDGTWADHLGDLGVSHLDHVLLTHSHDEQCRGLASGVRRGVAVHAPAGDQRYLATDEPGPAPPPWIGGGCPENYDPPLRRLEGVSYDLAGNGHLFWQGRRLRFMHTPGHTPNACSIVLDHDGKQVVFCGDAAHSAGTIHQPFHLEWDHWTGAGALAAWEGIERLRGIRVDLLCPAHGPVVQRRPRQMLGTLSSRLMACYRAKGQVSPGEPDRYVPVEFLDCGARRISAHLYQYAGNGYLLTSQGGEALVIDPHRPEMEALEALLQELGSPRPTACAVSHYHYDHCDAIPYLRQRYGARAWLHPVIAAPWQDPQHSYLPWLLPEPLEADQLWPERGSWQWNEYLFQVAPWPGQTWGHCAFMAPVDGAEVLFAGDSFTPTSKWNGTGGFCAYNNSRFADGFVPSALLALSWEPQIVAAGHGNTYYFSRSKFRKIAAWALRAEAAVRALCPSGDLEQDYYLVREVIAEQVRRRSRP